MPELNLGKVVGGPGNDGKAATVKVGTVSTNSSGSVTVTNTGTANDAILNFNISKGDKGSAASIKIGTVQTGAPGSKAEVKNVGNESAAILDMTIPRGEVGPGVDMSEVEAQIASAIAKAKKEAIPPGTIWQWGGTALPDASIYGTWAWCDGGTNNRNTDAALFKAIGTKYGSGNGSSTFNRPDFRNRFALGCDANSGGAVGGAQSYALKASELPSHFHDFYTYNYVGSGGRYTVPGVGAAVEHQLFSTRSTGDGQPHSNMPPYLSTPFIIKVL